MPIYMDRHDVSEAVTAHDIAHLHQEDLKIQDQFDCRGLTYWFDDKRKTAFCLIEAPNAEAIRQMHRQSHGDVPHSVIEVEPGIVESFLGRIADPAKAQNTPLNIIDDPAFRIIMVVALKRLSLLQTDAEHFTSAFNHFNSGVVKILNMYGGNLVKQTDYQYLVSFTSASNAVHAAFDIRVLFKDFTSNIMKDNIALKIGLNTGVPVTEEKSIFEDTIRLAERMCEIVKGDVIVSAEVKELYKTENANTFCETEGIFPLTPADEKFISLLMDYTDTAWSDTGLKVDDFSKPLGCSKSQLYRKMILLTGKSPNIFIKEYRLKEALKLLGKKASNISEIAFETGFTSPSYFSKCFQKHYGRSPSRYLPVNAG